jgi:hypothetical protein
MSASSKLRCSKVESTTTLLCGLDRRRSVMRLHRIGCISAMLRAPQHEGVGVLDVVVAAHRLVDAEGAHEAGHRAGHAVARVGVEVVGAETGLEELGGGIAFPDGPLAGAEHADAGRAVLQRLLPLLGHQVEGLVPADRYELAVLVVLAVLLTQQRLVRRSLPYMILDRK